ncbi:MAG: hypothetical protein P9M14_02965 [Candidatus Alcyoniella australis]|nr:hypothetical protein [Candidatus Alcyoniella australis]
MKLPAPFATAIGSLPFKEAAQAVDLMLQSFPTAPCWPQLPQRSWLENMDAQFAQGMAALSEDEQTGKVSVLIQGGPESPEEALERFWTPIIAGDDDPQRLAVGPERAVGLYELLRRFESGEERPRPVIKGQMTGPVTFGSSVKVEPSGKLLLFSPEFFEAARALLKVKASWQARILAPLGETTLVFVDEPALVSFGSAYLPISREDAIGWLDEVVAGVHEQGAFAGSHCCGNTDWSLLARSSIDVISFDAAEYFESLLLYARDLAAFFERGGCLAFGIVPTSEEVLQAQAADLAAQLDAQLSRLGQEIGWGRSNLLERLIITPACGYGTRSEQAATYGTQLCEQVLGKLG